MAEGESEQEFFVTRESQESLGSRKTSYAGLRDLSDLEKIKELDIVGPHGTIRGIKNRVRAGLATFENRGVLVKKNTEEGKIIAYTTSFRGVRRTYEECKYVLTVFHNLRVRVEERDIYVNTFYHQELEERLGKKNVLKLPVPQVYINGQHVGGATELEVLNETGELRKLIADIPRQESSTACPMCGGYEFIPCRKCGGSKNSVANEFTAEFRALKCTHCTENGLEPCPACEKRRANAKERKGENEAARKEKELRGQKENEKVAQEKRERIKREAIEAERQAQLEKEMEVKLKQQKKERAKREKERKKAAAEVRKRVAEEIARELEREKQWRAEHETKSNNVHSEDDLSKDKETAELVNDATLQDKEQFDSETEQSPEESILQEAMQDQEVSIGKEAEVDAEGQTEDEEKLPCVDEQNVVTVTADFQDTEDVTTADSGQDADTCLPEKENELHVQCDASTEGQD